MILFRRMLGTGNRRRHSAIKRFLRWDEPRGRKRIGPSPLQPLYRRKIWPMDDAPLCRTDAAFSRGGYDKAKVTNKGQRRLPVSLRYGA